MILLPLLAVVALCWPSFVALHRLWVNWELSSYTHGYLTLAVSIWLLWRNRQALHGGSVPRAWWSGLPLLAGGLAWLLAIQAGIQFIELAILPLLLWSAVLAACGPTAATKVTFPIALLNLATPLPTAFNSVFQWTSVYAVRAALRLFGIPAYFDANDVHIPEGTFTIAGGCSGLNFVLVGMMVALLMGELRGDGWRTRFRLVLIALTLALVTNWLRILIIIVAGHQTHMQHYLVSRSHYGFGWVLFAVSMVVFFLVERRIAVQPPAASVRRGDVNAPGRNSIGAVWQLAVLAFLGTVGGWRITASRPSTADLPPVVVPPEWTHRIVDDGGWQPRFAGIDEQRSDILVRNDVAVRRYMGLYRSQKQGKEMGGYYNDALGGLRQVEVVKPFEATRTHTIVRTEDPSGNASLLLIAYTIDDNYFASAVKGQLWYATRSLLTLRSPASKVVILRTDCLADCGSAARLLEYLEEQAS